MKDFKRVLMEDRDALSYLHSPDEDSDVVRGSDQGPSQEDINASSTTYLSQGFIRSFRK